MKQITIGRSKENDVVIEDPSVSRHHATIVQTEKGIVVYDNGSSNGTFINGARIQSEATLSPNDILKLGTALIPWKNYVQIGNKENEKTNIIDDKTNIIVEKPASGQTNYTNTSAAQNAGYTPPAPVRKKNNKGLVIGLSIFAFIVVVLVVLNIIKNNSSSYNDYYPNPVIVDQHVEYVEGGVLGMDKTLIGLVEVRNDANVGGNVEVIAYCEQEGNTYEDSKTLFLNPGESQVVEFEFSEIKRLQYEPTFSAQAFAVE